MEISNIRNSNSIDYISFKKELSIKSYVILINIILPWVMICANVFLISQIQNLYLNLLMIPISAFWMAFWVRAYLLHFHEIAHFNIHKNKKVNDIIGNVFFTPFFGMWIKQYRKHHWKHHNHLGTHADTEVSYHNPINLGEIISGLTGIYILKILFKYFLYFSKKNEESNYLKNIFLFISSVSLMIVTQIIISFILYNFFSIFLAISWLLGFFIFSPFLEKIRQTCEHRSFNSSKDIDYKKIEHGPVTRLFGDDFFSKYFGAAGFNKHLLHHIDPEVSYTRFKELEDFLVKSDLSNLILSNRSSYLKTFKSLYNK